MFYKNDDYTVRMEIIGIHERYFIKYHGQADSAEHEISLDIFMLYYREFNKPLERQRNEKRRHIEPNSLDYIIASGKLIDRTSENEDNAVSLLAVETAIEVCTPIQRRRFKLHYIQGYSYTEIAKKENCDEAAVRRSVSAALKKLKIFFGE
jgi:RNA polymerase sigma-70 factor (ECF subfamily)